jgi:hypothetical protein
MTALRTILGRRLIVHLSAGCVYGSSVALACDARCMYRLDRRRALMAAQRQELGVPISLLLIALRGFHTLVLAC